MAQTLPHNPSAEQSVLGCLMLDYVSCNIGIEKLNKSDFFIPAHQTIFEAMYNVLNKRNTQLDFVTTADALKTMGKLDSVGGLAYLNAISDSVPSVASFRHYFDIVKRDSLLRRINNAGTEIVKNSFQSDDAQTTLSEAEKLIFDISKSDEQRELTPITDELANVVSRLDLFRRDPGAIYGIKTGFYALDNMTNGLHGGELIVLAARPGVGKTSLGLNMILNAAIRAKKKCAIFSLEMSKYSLTQRAICSLAMVSSYHAGRGELTDEEWTRLLRATDTLNTPNIYIDDNSEITPTEIKRKCMRLRREHGLDFIMVDYLGLMQAPSGKSKGFENRQQEVSANSRAMKVLAKELDMPVLLLAQLNREVATQNGKSTDKRPQLHHLRESGAIEQDADIVMFIHLEKPTPRADDYEEESDKTGEASRSAASAPVEAELIIAKHRNGPTGTVKLKWISEFTTFQNTDDDAAAQSARDKIKPEKVEKLAQKQSKK